ncbi:sigma-70 family RNA polymerase sigma factor [Flavobacteriaceae bacterium TP-CH-4]|uniref:Sigma-70 family RNA polymerase sigma factor n=1 Tax=Pelagihabitans pacificus TaxID=2696054 RepID=A0A967ATL7_9FLAO|nr:sigma-70 family RNA polymerase sigma factor [Pelagihabitans pacificus]NHF58753.1 sigma-70 family RNA polymerase sigma factor [Pelagihabitans pacificus]
MDADQLKRIEVLFVEHYHEWCMLAFSYLGESSAAEDVVQEVFLRMILPKRNHIVHLRGYVKVSIRNACLKHIRKQRRQIAYSDHEAVVPSYEISLIDSERKAIINNSINALPEKARRIFQLCVIQGVRYKMAATTLGLSVNTVKYHLKKSFKSLRLSLRDTYFTFLLLPFVCL